MPTRARKETAPPAGGNGFSIISKAKLLALYKALLRCRAFDDRFTNRRELETFRQSNNGCGRKGPTPHAAAVAALIDLLPGDTVLAAKADFIPRFLRGATANAILANLRGPAVSDGASLPLLLRRALRAGRARKRRHKRRIAVAFWRHESEAPTLWRETLRTAGAERLPILFIRCHQLALPRAKATAETCGVPAIAVDANDVVALYRVACESIAHARRGNGPTLIECVPWPLPLPQDGAVHDATLKMERYMAHSGIPFLRSQCETAETFARERRTAAKRSRSGPTRRTTRPE